MKGQRMLLLLLFGALLAAGWLAVVRSASGAGIREKQNELVAQADEYGKKELYVRAVPLYEEALTLSSSQNPSIEEKLLAAYQAYGDFSSYIRLVEKRSLEQTARRTEYIQAADYYMASSKIQEAMALIRKGMEALKEETEDAQALEAYYEAYRYGYQVRETRFTAMIPTASNSLMPAFDGEKWGYVDERGMGVLSFVYDSATPFNAEGCAVVSAEGTYCTILQNGDRYGVDDGTRYPRMTDVLTVSKTRVLGKRDGSYSYFNYDFEPIAPGHQYTQMTANACGVAAVKKDSGWGIITDSGETAVDFTLEDLAVNSLGCAFAGDRAMVKENGSWYLIDPEGNRIGETGFAGAKAPESYGCIAVADSTGQWGYIDREGNLVIDYQYADALSFSDGLAAVRIVNDWGYISEKNVLVIEDVWSEAWPFHNGVAQADLSGNISLITLNYREE